MIQVKQIPCDWRNELPVYASEEFLRTAGDECGWLGGFGQTGELRCILPFVVIRKPGFRVVRFQTGVVSLHDEITVGEEYDFLTGAMSCFRSGGIDMVIPGTNAAIFRTFPEGAIAAPYGTYIKDLTQSEDALMKEIHPTYRYNIRRAIREGVQIKEGMEYLDASYHLAAETMRRSGQAFADYEKFKSGILALGKQVTILIAEAGGVCQGCMIAPFSEYAAYTRYCGSRPEPVIGAMHLLHWEAMRRFRLMGVKRFNFQGVRINPEKGSKQEGIMNFKRQFGGTLSQGFTWKYAFRPLKYAAYGVAMRWLRGGDIVDAEHHKLAGAGS